MRVIRTALLAVGFALVGLCWMTGCKTRHGTTPAELDTETLQGQINKLNAEVYAMCIAMEALAYPTITPSPNGAQPTPDGGYFDKADQGMINENGLSFWCGGYVDPTMLAEERSLDNGRCEDSGGCKRGDLIALSNGNWYAWCGYGWSTPDSQDVEAAPSPSPAPADSYECPPGYMPQLASHDCVVDINTYPGDRDTRPFRVRAMPNREDAEPTPSPSPTPIVMDFGLLGGPTYPLACPPSFTDWQGRRYTRDVSELDNDGEKLIYKCTYSAGGK